MLLQVIVENLATKGQTLLEGVSGPVTCVAVSADGGRVVAGSAVPPRASTLDAPTEHSLVVWEYSHDGKYWCEKTSLWFDRANALPVSAVAFDPTGRYVAATGVNGSGGLRGQHLILY